MNIDGGGLEFEAILKNQRLNAAVAESERKVMGFTQTVVSGGNDIDKAYEETAWKINSTFNRIDKIHAEHTETVKKLEAEYDKLTIAAGEAFMSGKDSDYQKIVQRQTELNTEINVRRNLISEVEQQADALAEVERNLESERKKLKDSEKAHVSYRTRIRELKEALIEMEAAGDRNSIKYDEMRLELARLTDAMSDANAQASILAHDQAGFQGIISGLSGITGAFSAAQGAIGLFAGQNEDLQKIMLKVQSLMAITIGLQQVSAVLNKDSAFMLVTVAKLKKGWATATAFLNTQLGITVGLSKALMATGIGVLIAGIGLLISKLMSQSKAQEEANKKAEEAKKVQEELAAKIDKTASSYGNQVSEIEAYRAALNSENISHNKKLEIIKKLQGIIPGYTAALDSEGRVIRENKRAIDEYLMSLEKSLKFKAAQEELAEIYKEIYKIETASKPSIYKEGDFGGEKIQILDAKGIAERRGLSTTDDIPAQYFEMMKQQDEALFELQNTLSEKRMTELRDKIKTINTYIQDNGLLDLNVGGSGDSSNKKDPFLENLEQKKKQYQEYFVLVNSGDQELIDFAKSQYADLLKEGDNYLDYLQKQKELTEDVNDVAKLNQEIAGETKKTVLQSFNSDLQDQLNSASSVLEMLNIVDSKRKELANDNSEIDNSKKETLDKAEQNIVRQAKEETDALLNQYASFLTKKLQMEQQYTSDMILLQNRLNEASDEEEKKRIQAAIDNRKRVYEMESQKSGDNEYDDMLEMFRSYEEKRTAISEEFEEKRRIAKEHGNIELIERLNEAEQKALSSLALDELIKSPDWSKLFGNLDELTTKQINKLIQQIESNKAQLGIEFDPKDLEAIMSKLEEAKSVVESRNPFKALINGIKEFSGAADEEAKRKSLSKIFESAGASLDLVKGSMDAVIGGLAEMGWAGDEVTQELLGDISELVGASSQLASGIATGNPLSIIQGSIGVLTSAFKVFNTHDRKAERQIRKHKEAVDVLKSAYRDLERAVQKALGGDYYKAQQNSIENLRKQQEHLLEMKRKEQDKKKTDKNKVKEYEEQYKELARQIEDIIDEIASSITQTSAKDLANDLADAIVDAFSKGENAAEAFEETARKVMQNAVKNALKLQLLEKPLQKAVDDLQKNMGHWEGDEFVFDGLTEREQQQFKNQVASIGASFAEALKLYEDLFKDLNIEEFDDSLAGAVKGVSEETASLVAGQMNAMRINQIESLEIMRQQLERLTQISRNTSYNVHLEKLDGILEALKGAKTDPLRSEGLF